MLAREFEDAMTESRAHPDPHQPAEPTWLAVMTTAGKVILGFGTAAYVLGIIVVNLHLGRYGYHSLGLLEASFVAAGWWAFAPIVLAMMLILSIKFMFWEAKLFARAEAAKLATPANPQPSAAPLSSWHQLFVCLEGVIAWLLFLVFLVYLLDIRWTWFWLAAMGLGCLSVGGILLVPTMIGRQSVKGDTLALISQLGVSCMVLPFYLILFARQVYPTIPPELGGGGGRQVVLVAKDEKAQAHLMSVGVRFDKDQFRSLPQTLLLVTEKDLLLLPEALPAVRVESDLVAAVVYLRD